MPERPSSSSAPDAWKKAALAAPQFTLLSDAALDFGADDGADLLDYPRQLASLYDLLRHPATPTPARVALVGPAGGGKSSALRWLAQRLKVWNESRPDEAAGVPVRVVWFHAARHGRRLRAGLLSELLLGVVDFGAISGESLRRTLQVFRPVLGAEFVRAAAMAKIERGAGLGPRAKADLGWVESLLDERDGPGLVPRAAVLLSPIFDELRATVRAGLKGGERVALFVDDLDGLSVAACRSFMAETLADVAIERVVTVLAVTEQMLHAGRAFGAGGSDESRTGFEANVDLVVTLRAGEDRVARILDQRWARLSDSLWNSVPAEERRTIARVVAALAGGNARSAARLANAMGDAARTQASGAVGAERLERFRAGLADAALHTLLERRHQWGSLWSQAWGRELLGVWRAAAQASPEDTSATIAALCGELGRLDADGPKGKSGVAPLPGRGLVELLRKNPQRRELTVAVQDADAWRLLKFAAASHHASPADDDLDGRIVREAIAREMGGSRAASEVAGCERVQALNLAGLEVSDIGPLRECRALRRLDLSRTRISDLAPLNALIALERLDASHTPVADLWPLANCFALRELRLDGTQVRDLRPLERTTGLVALSLRGAPVSDLLPLLGQSALTELDLAGTRVTDIRPLAGLPALRTLNLSDTEVADVIPLSDAAELVSLRLRNTRVDVVEPLARVASLRLLDLGNTPMEDGRALAALVQLSHLDLQGTLITELSGWLPELIGLERLDLSATGISSIAGVESLNNLRLLTLARTGVTSMAPLARLRRLEELDVSQTRVLDFAPLRGCRALRLLVVSPGQLADDAAADLKRSIPTLRIEEAETVEPLPAGKLSAPPGALPPATKKPGQSSAAAEGR